MALNNSFQNPKIPLNNICVLKQPENTYSIQKYISNNRISPFILFTVTNNCCKCIMIYHNMLNKYHGDTDISRFYMYEDYECVLIEPEDKDIDSTVSRELTHSRKYKDFAIFFNSLNKQLLHKNKHFTKIFDSYQTSIIESLFMFQLNKNELYK